MTGRTLTRRPSGYRTRVATMVDGVGESWISIARSNGSVAYRLRRAEELRGMRIDERQLELWVALLLVDVMGS